MCFGNLRKESLFSSFSLFFYAFIVSLDFFYVFGDFTFLDGLQKNVEVKIQAFGLLFQRRAIKS